MPEAVEKATTHSMVKFKIAVNYLILLLITWMECDIQLPHWLPVPLSSSPNILLYFFSYAKHISSALLIWFSQTQLPFQQTKDPSSAPSFALGIINTK